MTQLKLFRQTNGLTQKELADYLGKRADASGELKHAEILGNRPLPELSEK